MIVLRSTYDAIRVKYEAMREAKIGAEVRARSLAHHVTVLEEQVAYLRAEMDKATERLMDLRREGFDPPSPLPPEIQKPEEDLPPEVRMAIEMVAEPGDPLWMQEVANARRALELNVRAEEVAERIRRGADHLNPHWM